MDKYLLPRIYFSPDEDGGGSPINSDETPPVEQIVDDESMDSDESGKPGDGSQEGSDGGDSEPPTDAADQDFQAKAAKLGYIKAQEPKNEAEDEEHEAEPDVPDYRIQAYNEAEKLGKTPQWAENRALQLAAEDIQKKTAEAQLAQTLQASRPSIQANTASIIETRLGASKELASELAKIHTDIVMNMGIQAFDGGESEKNPKVRAEKAKFKENLQTSAYYQALGIQYEKELLKARNESTDESGNVRKVAPARGAGPTNGHALYAGVDDVPFLKDMESKFNDGKPFTRKQVEVYVNSGAVAFRRSIGK